jgi:hypothetical protein
VGAGGNQGLACQEGKEVPDRDETLDVRAGRLAGGSELGGLERRGEIQPEVTGG